MSENVSGAHVRRARKPRTVTQTLVSIVLTCESLVIFLGALVLYGLDAFAVFGWPNWSALLVGLAVLILSLMAIGLSHSRLGIALGWIVQGLLILGGLVNAVLFVVGVIFAALWWYAIRAGARIDQRDDPNFEASKS